MKQQSTFNGAVLDAGSPVELSGAIALRSPIRSMPSGPPIAMGSWPAATRLR